MWWRATSSTSSGEPDRAGMTVRRLAAVDAQTYWMSAKIPNDQFLLYGFAGVPANLDQAIDVIRGRADECAELRLRVRDGSVLTYPAWVSGDVDAGPVRGARPRRQQLGGMSGRRRRAGRRPTRRARDDLAAARLHAGRRRTRRRPGTGTVAVLQATHALADGIRCSALAALLFGRRGDGAAGDGAATVSRRRAAVAQHSWPPVPIASWSATPRPDWCPRRRIHDPRCAPTPGRPERAASARWSGTATSCAGPTVTVGVLAAVSTALSAHLRELGDDPSTLGAEVPMAKTGVRQAHNHFGNVGVGLYPELEFGERAHGSPRTSHADADVPPIRRCERRAGRSRRFPRRCCAGVWRSSTRTCGRRPSSATPWCPASIAARRTCASAGRRSW